MGPSSAVLSAVPTLSGPFGTAWAIGLAIGLGWGLWLRRRSLVAVRSKLADAAEREAFLSTVITSEPSCVKTLSPDLKLMSMNPAGLAAIEAESFAEVDGADVRNIVHPEDLEQFLALHERVLEGESVSARFRIFGLKGCERWMETHAAPMRGADGEVLRHLAVTNDVTDQVRMEQRLVQARDAAIAGTRAKSEFLANMSHEIRTPMVSILGWSEVLLEHLQQDPVSSEKLSIIQRNGRHLLSILDDILDLSRIESGKETLKREVLCPGALLEDIRLSLLPRAQKCGLELSTESATGLPAAIYTDRKRVRQVLVNLTNNALKFTQAGSVTLRVAVEKHGEETGIVFRVCDTGPGIAPGDLDKMFHAFEQADTTTSRRHGGVGLGLAISRGIADLLGGFLSLESRVGTGTTAILRLPLDLAPGRDANLDSSASEPGSTSRPDPAPDLQGRRVLLVEDGPDNQLLISHLLKRAGCEVEVAGNGQEAVEMVAAASRGESAFDAILMDVQMPIMDGHTATRAIRAAGVTTPIIALTAHAMVGDREKALAAGCTGYLTKPVRGRDLIAELGARATAAAAETGT